MATPTQIRRRGRFGLLLGTLVAALALTAVAYADQQEVDNDLASGGNQNVVSLTVSPGATVNTTGQLVITRSGGNHLASNTSVTFTVDAAPTNLPAGYSVADVTVNTGSWTSNGQQVWGSSAVSFTAPAAPGSYVFTVKWETTVDFGNRLTGGPALTINLEVTAPPPSNEAPVVATEAADALGDEGDTLAASGSFSDPDGDALELTADNTAGTFVDNADGTWSWSLATDDDVAQSTITVTATDGDGATATDSFDYAAANVDPALGALARLSTNATNCDVTLSFSFSDPGSADTHEGSIDWGDGTGTDAFIASPVSQGHSYASAGTYTIDVSVSDDDGGSDSDATSNTVYNAASGVLQPINANGSSVFKLGSTIPVKITVTDCGGAPVASLAPVVSLARVAPSASGVNEVVSSSAADSGNTMRYDPTGQQYIFNLSTKRSQFNSGHDLTAGTYQLTIGHPSFAAPVTAAFGIKS